MKEKKCLGICVAALTKWGFTSLIGLMDVFSAQPKPCFHGLLSFGKLGQIGLLPKFVWLWILVSRFSLNMSYFFTRILLTLNFAQSILIEYELFLSVGSRMKGILEFDYPNSKFSHVILLGPILDGFVDLEILFLSWVDLEILLAQSALGNTVSIYFFPCRVWVVCSLQKDAVKTRIRSPTGRGPVQYLRPGLSEPLVPNADASQVLLRDQIDGRPTLIALLLGHRQIHAGGDPLRRRFTLRDAPL